MICDKCNVAKLSTEYASFPRGSKSSKLQRQHKRTCLSCLLSDDEGLSAGIDRSFLELQHGLTNKNAEFKALLAVFSKGTQALSTQHLHLRTVAGAMIQVEVPASDQTQDVLQVVQDKLGVRANEFILLHAGTRLKRGTTLSNLGVQGGTVLRVVMTTFLARNGLYALENEADNITLSLTSDSEGILCGACLVFDDDNACVETVNYSTTSGGGGALTHSGDQRVEGKSKHVISMQLRKLPPRSSKLFFTLCACSTEAQLSHFRAPQILLTEQGDDFNLCKYDLNDAGDAPTAVMAALVKSPAGAWNVKALGVNATQKCCSNYGEVQAICKGMLEKGEIA